MMDTKEKLKLIKNPHHSKVNILILMFRIYKINKIEKLKKLKFALIIKLYNYKQRQLYSLKFLKQTIQIPNRF